MSASRRAPQGNRRTGGPLDPQTVLHTHRRLHAAMQRAVKWRLVPVNPVDGMELPHVPANERDFLTADESEQLVLRTYGYLLPGVDREAADRLGEVVKRRVQPDGR